MNGKQLMHHRGKELHPLVLEHQVGRLFGVSPFEVAHHEPLPFICRKLRYIHNPYLIILVTSHKKRNCQMTIINRLLSEGQFSESCKCL